MGREAYWKFPKWPLNTQGWAWWHKIFTPKIYPKWYYRSMGRKYFRNVFFSNQFPISSNINFFLVRTNKWLVSLWLVKEQKNIPELISTAHVVTDLHRNILEWASCFGYDCWYGPISKRVDDDLYWHSHWLSSHKIWCHYSWSYQLM